MLHTPVCLDDGQTVDVAASVGAATSDILNTRDLPLLQRAVDAALYDGKHSGRAAIAHRHRRAHDHTVHQRMPHGAHGHGRAGAIRMNAATLPPADD